MKDKKTKVINNDKQKFDEEMKEFNQYFKKIAKHNNINLKNIPLVLQDTSTTYEDIIAPTLDTANDDLIKFIISSLLYNLYNNSEFNIIILINYDGVRTPALIEFMIENKNVIRFLDHINEILLKLELYELIPDIKSIRENYDKHLN
jgi:hypothetical protein